MSTSAGYVDIGADLGAALRRLGGLRPGVPVLTMYLDLDPREFATQRDRGSAITSLLDEAHKRVEEHEGDHDAKVSLRADLVRAAEFLADWTPKRARGVALFCAAKANIFEAIPLPRPVQAQVIIDDSPFVTPLAQAADTRDWLIVAVDTLHARILHGNIDHIEEFEPVSDAVKGEHKGSGDTNYQRWVEHERAHERRQLDRLAAGLGRGERAVAGIEQVHDMLVQQRVETLLYDDRQASPDAAQLEAMIEQAVAQSAEVQAVRHFPDELASHGHVAAVLRF